MCYVCLGSLAELPYSKESFAPRHWGCQFHQCKSFVLEISVGCLGKNVHKTVLDEGVVTCIMSYSCWQALGSPTLIASQTVLKAFDGHLFSPHGILAAFPIEIGGKIVTVEVEVVNTPLDYNLLLGRSWFYPM